MPYTLIKGTYLIFYPEVNSPSGQPKPDGDTIKFIPDDPNTFATLKRPPGTCIDLSADWKVSVRFEAIDALELHFPDKGGDYRQEFGLAKQARDRMLELLGFGHPQFLDPNLDDCPIQDTSRFAAVDPNPNKVRGYLLARDVDSNGRVIAFVFPGDHPQPDGSAIEVDDAAVRPSVNATLLRESLAYPTLYTTMPPDLRPVFIDITRQARAENVVGRIWANATVSPTKSENLASLCMMQSLVIWPKLFRRLVKYFNSGYEDLTQFETWLRADPRNRDDKMLLPNGDWGNMHDMVEVQGAQIRTVFQPEDVVIEPDDTGVTLQPIQPRWDKRDVRIIAALVNPVDRNDAGKEVITLLNALPFQLDLTGWQLVTVSPQGREKTQALDGVLLPGAIRTIIWTAGSLSNSGSTIRLVHPKNGLIDTVTYTEAQASCVGQTIIF